MIDPFTYWSRLFAVSAHMTQTAMRTAQTINASNVVIEKRTNLMRAAIGDPVNANLRELGQMVPEKLGAFTSAGNAVIDGWLAWNTAMLSEAHHIGAMAMRGRAPTPIEWMALAERGQAFGLSTAEGSARTSAAALKPIHRKAIANAKRLGKRKQG